MMGITIFIFYQTIQSQPTFVLKYACSKVKINNKNNDLFLQLLSLQLKTLTTFYEKLHCLQFQEWRTVATTKNTNLSQSPKLLKKEVPSIPRPVTSLPNVADVLIPK